jgi:hypothetical protein
MARFHEGQSGAAYGNEGIGELRSVFRGDSVGSQVFSMRSISNTGGLRSLGFVPGILSESLKSNFGQGLDSVCRLPSPHLRVGLCNGLAPVYSL